MNETVHYRGKMQFLKKMDGEDIEKQCKRILNDLISQGYHVNIKEFDSYQDALQYGLVDNQYIVIGEDLYCIIAKRYISENNIFNVIDNNDGTFDYEIKYFDSYLNHTYGFDEILRKSFEQCQ
ncbi:MAG: hypothetical protein NC124_18705 [Clostridium sp.]|nr:hypothetical protein [Clostridium sp.]